MDSLVAFLVLLSLAMILYAYFGYALLLLGLRPKRNATSVSLDQLPTIAVLITVRNEEQVIREKLEQTLELRYGDRTVAEHLSAKSGLVDLLVASDCSDDGTDAVIESFAERGVRLVRLAERGGKEKAQREAVGTVTAEIVVFTDAKIQLNEDALNNFVQYFADTTVGAVSSTDQVLSDDGVSSGEGFYVRYEMWLRQLESSFNSLVGLSGSCFAVRRSVADHLRTDIPSDFALLLESQRQGMRGVHGGDVIGSYKAVRTEKEEFQRKVRTVLRGITAFFASSEVLNPAKFGIFSWQVASHKLCRWLVPWFLLVVFIGSFGLAFKSGFFALLLIGQLFFYGAALAAYLQPELQKQILAKVPLFFTVVNMAIGVAWLKYLSGQRSVTWNPSAKGK